MNASELASAIDEYFNLDEMETLCLELFIKFENIRGDTAAKKAENLVTYCQRHDKMDNLITALNKARPSVSWVQSNNSPAERETHIKGSQPKQPLKIFLLNIITDDFNRLKASPSSTKLLFLILQGLFYFIILIVFIPYSNILALILALVSLFVMNIMGYCIRLAFELAQLEEADQFPFVVIVILPLIIAFIWLVSITDEEHGEDKHNEH